MAITESLLGFSIKEFSAPKPYWKIESLFEFTFTVLPADQDTFRSIIAFRESGWIHLGSANDVSSVWNRIEHSTFLAPEIEWAEVSLHELTS